MKRDTVLTVSTPANGYSVLQLMREVLKWLFPIVCVTFFIIAHIRDDSNLFRVIFWITLSGLVGFYTNWIAIKMLFHPKKPLPLSRFQGLIPRNQTKLAHSIGLEIQQKLLSPEIISDYVKKENLIEKFGKLAISQVSKAAESPKFRNFITKQVGKWIQGFSTENLDPVVDRVIKWIDEAMLDEKMLRSLLNNFSKLLNWVLKHEKFADLVGKLTSSLAKSSLSDNGAIANIIHELVKDLQRKLGDKTFQAKTTEWLVGLVRDISDEDISSAYEAGLKALEKILTDKNRTAKLVSSITNVLSQIASNPKVIDYISETIADMLEKNSVTIAEMLNDIIDKWIDQMDGGFLGIKRAIVKYFRSHSLDSSTVRMRVGEFARSKSTRAKIHKLFKDKIKLAKLLEKKSTQNKIVTLLLKYKPKIIEYCSVKGKTLVVSSVERVLASKGFWSFVESKVSNITPRIGEYGRRMVPSIISYLRGFVQKQDLGGLVQKYFEGNIDSIVEKLVTRESSTKLSKYISSNREAFYNVLDTKLRPWLTGILSRLLSSGGFWEWVEEIIESSIPKVTAKLEHLAASEKARNWLENKVPQLASGLHLNRIVEDQVNKFDTGELERMVNDVSGENLAGIEVFGGFLGLAAGTLLIIEETMVPAVVVFGLSAAWIGAEFVARRIRKNPE